jgi:hypothetical protein
MLRVQGKVTKRSTMPLNPLAGILKDAKNLGFLLDCVVLNFIIDPSHGLSLLSKDVILLLVLAHL